MKSQIVQSVSEAVSVEQGTLDGIIEQSTLVI